MALGTVNEVKNLTLYRPWALEMARSMTGGMCKLHVNSMPFYVRD